MIAIDTNILVYAHRSDSPKNEAASSALIRASRTRWAIPWPCVHEFLAVTTHPIIFDPPSPIVDATRTIAGWYDSRTLRFIGESADYWPTLESLILKSEVCGPRVNDARIAAICIQHGVSELWTADRDFRRFSSLKTVNPL